jgi:hypothetical protein
LPALSPIELLSCAVYVVLGASVAAGVSVAVRVAEA